MGANLKIVTVDPQDMWRALSTPHALHPLFDTDKVPDGAVVRSVHVEYNTGTGLGRVAITLEHPSFPPVEELQEIERMAMGCWKSKGGEK